MANKLFSSLLNDVYVHTNRPDLVNETTLAIKKATSKAHGSDEFPEDFVQVAIVTTATNDPAVYIVDVTAAPFVRHRKVLHIVNTYTKQQYKPITLDDLFDSYGITRTDCWYKAGLNYVLNAVSGSQVTVTYLQNPDVTPDTYSSWIALMHPEAIVEEAASQVFKMIGKDTEFQRYAQLSMENFMRLKQHHLIGY